MPSLEISIPRLDATIKHRVAHALTEAFAASTPFGADIFGIRFFEYDPGAVYVGGRIADEASDHPYLHFLFYCPRLKRDGKQKLATALTQAFIVSTGKPSWQPIIHICEHPYDNVAVEGRLLSDAYEECAKRKFYYELPQIEL